MTLPCKNLPWYISLKISAFDTASSAHSSGQLSNTCCAISAAESLVLKRYSFVLPLTSINLRLILSVGIFLDPILLPLISVPPSISASGLAKTNFSILPDGPTRRRVSRQFVVLRAGKIDDHKRSTWPPSQY